MRAGVTVVQHGFAFQLVFELPPTRAAVGTRALQLHPVLAVGRHPGTFVPARSSLLHGVQPIRAAEPDVLRGTTNLAHDLLSPTRWQPPSAADAGEASPGFPPASRAGWAIHGSTLRVPPLPNLHW